MDDTVKMMLSSYESGIQNYRKSLGDDNAAVIKAVECFEKLKAIGESSKDIMEFTGKTTDLLPEMSKLFMDLYNEKPVHKVAPEVPTSEKMAMAYHMSYNSIQDKEKSPETCKVYERIFEIEKQSENGLQFLRLITEEGLLIKMSSISLMETSQRLLQNQQDVSLPQMDYYHQNMINEMREAKSTAEIDYYSNIRADISYYENQWDTFYLIVIYVNLGNAITSYMLSRTEENRQCVEYSYRFLAKYFSLTYDELMALPRIRDYFNKMIWVTIREKYTAMGCDTPEKYFESEKALLMQCIDSRAPIEFGNENRKMLTFFGKQYHVRNEVPGLYAKAPHPDDNG
jgi:ASC-1-like (ASCH) protein